MDDSKSIESPNPQRNAASVYFVSPIVDFLLIGGGSFFLYFALRFLHSGNDIAPIAEVANVMTWIINWPHFAATIYRLYHTKENRAEYPVTAYAVPLLVLGGMLMGFIFPGIVAPYFIKLYLLWSPYHYSGQTVGISLIYAQRAGVKIESWERRILSFFVYCSFVTPFAISEAGGAGQLYGAYGLPILGIPQWIGTALKISLCASGLALAFIALRWKLSIRKTPNLMIFLPAATLLLWFIPGGKLASFNAFVPMFHGMQYMLIAWMMQLKEKMVVTGAAPSRRFVIDESVRWFFGNIAVGSILFYVLPKIAALLGYSNLLFYTLVTSAVQIHHFFVDGVIWKLKNQRVSSPLKVNIKELFGGMAA